MPISAEVRLRRIFARQTGPCPARTMYNVASGNLESRVSHKARGMECSGIWLINDEGAHGIALTSIMCSILQPLSYTSLTGRRLAKLMIDRMRSAVALMAAQPSLVLREGLRVQLISAIVTTVAITEPLISDRVARRLADRFIEEHL